MTMITPIQNLDIMLQAEEAFWLAGGLCLFLTIIPFIIGILIAIWMYKDAKKRDENAVLWLIVGLLLGIIGLIIWIVIRPDMAEVERKRQEKQMGMGGYHQPPQQQYQPYQQPPPQQQPPRACPDCSGNMRYISDYNRWYCDTCQGYK